MTDEAEKAYEAQIEAMARQIVPIAWAALGVGDTWAYKKLRDRSLEQARAAAEAIGLKPGMVVVPVEADGGMKFQGGLAIEDAAFQEGKVVFEAAGDCYAAMVAAALFQPAKAG